MGLKETFEKAIEDVKDAAATAADNFKDTLEDAKDAASEASHRAVAQAEQTQRDVAGDEMTAGEKVTSVVNEAINNVQAEIDKAKQDLRNDT